MKFVTSVFLFFLGITLVSSASILNQILRPLKAVAPAYRPSEPEPIKPTYNGKTPSLHQYANVEYPDVFEWGYKRGKPGAHVRGQVFNQKGSTFKSALNWKDVHSGYGQMMFDYNHDGPNEVATSYKPAPPSYKPATPPSYKPSL